MSTIGRRPLLLIGAADYLAGRVVVIGGWIMSETEAAPLLQATTSSSSAGN